MEVALKRKNRCGITVQALNDWKKTGTATRVLFGGSVGATIRGE